MSRCELKDCMKRLAYCEDVERYKLYWITNTGIKEKERCYLRRNVDLLDLEGQMK
jgi:hypothetical protein